ncbi:hypothetical protein [Fortiea contorta]|uniref:hypothetical protein n=1 Tax=Fortiea contorta TaxID=1892405 RepID=UPI001EE66BC5|nr:hypothetical protein [Fortiea contorta]
MPKVLAQGKTIECVGAKQLVVRHGVAYPSSKPSIEQVDIHLQGCKAHKAWWWVCTHVASTYLRKTLPQTSTDLYNGGAEAIKRRLIGSYHQSAVEVENEVSAASWLHKAQQTLLFPFSYNSRAFSLSN